MPSVTRLLRIAYKYSTRSAYIHRSFCTTRKCRRNVPGTVLLKVGGSGHVALNILKPQVPPSETSHDVLIVLPSGPALQTSHTPANTSSQTPGLLARLSEALPSTTIIGLNYRLSSPKHPYPIPIHDTATAFTYIVTPSSAHNAGHAPKVSLLGSNIGGSLALMLALTSPSLIHSVQVIEPFVDWVSLDDRKSKAKDSLTQDALAHLLKLRFRLFNTPSTYFDPFASPVLFLRAPGRDTPAADSSPLSEIEDYPNPEVNSGADAFGPYDDDIISVTPQTPMRRRKVLKRWPPVSMSEDVVLPSTRIMLREGGGLNAIMRAQGKEMADLMLKACFWGRAKGFGEERVKTETVADGKIEMDEVVKWAVKESGEPGE